MLRSTRVGTRIVRTALLVHVHRGTKSRRNLGLACCELEDDLIAAVVHPHVAKSLGIRNQRIGRAARQRRRSIVGRLVITRLECHARLKGRHAVTVEENGVGRTRLRLQTALGLGDVLLDVTVDLLQGRTAGFLVRIVLVDPGHARELLRCGGLVVGSAETLRQRAVRERTDQVAAALHQLQTTLRVGIEAQTIVGDRLGDTGQDEVALVDREVAGLPYVGHHIVVTLESPVIVVAIGIRETRNRVHVVRLDIRHDRVRNTVVVLQTRICTELQRFNRRYGVESVFGVDSVLRLLVHIAGNRKDNGRKSENIKQFFHIRFVFISMVRT